MPIKLPFDSNQPISGEASIELNKSKSDIFDFVADHFFDNYQKWATDVVELEPLDSKEISVGTKGKQVREDNGNLVESVFEVTEYKPTDQFVFSGITAPYRHTYIISDDETKQRTKLTFRFELLELDVFMRPFQKLIRVAIEDGAENTVENINNLLSC